MYHLVLIHQTKVELCCQFFLLQEELISQILAGIFVLLVLLYFPALAELLLEIVLAYCVFQPLRQETF
jgi:hypothetical protein